jgi:hypothetical protein
MIVITADQIDSTHTDDLAGTAVDSLNSVFGEHLARPADRNAGDEIQAMTTNADAALGMILSLLRTGQWSVGCGIGSVRLPLAANTREASGPSFVAARQAVERAKRAPHRFACASGADDKTHAADVASLVELLLLVRSRRSDEGWELFDLISGGMTQAEAADHLGISPQAASQRAKAAAIKIDLAAVPALSRLLDAVNTDH